MIPWKRWAALGGTVMILGWGGCASKPNAAAIQTEQQAAARLREETLPPKPAEPTDAAKPAVKATAMTIEIVVPAKDGPGVVVVDSRPIGRAPQTVTVPVTPQGFLAAPMKIGVRFVGDELAEVSVSIDTVLETTDRPPQRLEFTREGSRRVFARML